MAACDQWEMHPGMKWVSWYEMGAYLNKSLMSPLASAAASSRSIGVVRRRRREGGGGVAGGGTRGKGLVPAMSSRVMPRATPTSSQHADV